MKRKSRSLLTSWCLLSVLLIITTQSFLLFANGSVKYNYYELSLVDRERIVIKLNKHHLPLDVNLLREQLGVGIRPIPEHEVTSSDRQFEVNGGIMATSQDGNRDQRRKLETKSIIIVLQDAINLFSSSQPIQIDPPEEQAEETLEVDFFFQPGLNLGSMMDGIHQTLSELQRTNDVQGYRVRAIEYRSGRRGSLLIEVTSSLSRSRFSELLNRRFEGFFILSGLDSGIPTTEVQSLFRRIQFNIVTDRSDGVSSALRELRERVTDLVSSGSRALWSSSERERGSSEDSALYFYRVEALPENTSESPLYFVLSPSSRLEENSGELPFRFARVRNDRRFASGIPITLQNAVVLSDHGSVGGDEMSILYELLSRSQTFRSLPPPDLANYTTYRYYLYFTRNDDEPVTGFVDRVIASLSRLGGNEYYQYVVSRAFPRDGHGHILRFEFLRYVRMNAQMDYESRRFLEHVRSDDSVSQAYLHRLLSFTPRQAEVSQNVGLWQTIVRWLARRLGGRLFLGRTATRSQQAFELENVVVSDSAGQFRRRPSVDRTAPGAGQASLKKTGQP